MPKVCGLELAVVLIVPVGHELGTVSGRGSVFVCHVAVDKQSLVLILWLGTSRKQPVSFPFPFFPPPPLLSPFLSYFPHQFLEVFHMYECLPV